jgi:Tetratricopeptide repeat
LGEVTRPGGLGHNYQLGSLAKPLFRQEKISDADAVIRRALVSFEKTFDVIDPNMPIAVHNLAIALSGLGKDSQEKGVGESFEDTRLFSEKKHSRRQLAMSNLVGLLCDRGTGPQAEDLSRLSLKGFEEAFGPEHPLALRSICTLIKSIKCSGKTL